MRAIATCLLALTATAVAAQDPAPSPEPSRGVVVRVAGGLAGLSLGDAAAFHQSVADAYVAVGVPVPTQRALGVGPTGGIDVLVPFRDGRVGVGVRAAESSAYSLYGDYAGTLDVVSRVRVVFVESVSVAELPLGGPVRPFVGSRGGSAFATLSTRDALDLDALGTAGGEVRGSGTGYVLEGFGGVAVAAGPVGLFGQAGYRYARVPRLNGAVRVGGETVEEGALPFGLSLSGWTGVVGVTLRY
jgi:hypothetical protein